MEIKTLKDLKGFLDGLNEEQLSADAKLYLVDQGTESIASGLITSEDMYENDEGWDPISTFEPYDEEDKLENYAILKAGFAYLCNE